MFTIGAFARHGRVSVRMLRHYDAIGLLRPARVQEGSGYRSYTADQLDRLNRIVVLKELGFTLGQVRSVLDETVTVEELRGMLRLRRGELQERIAADTARLAQVEARLHVIEREGAVAAAGGEVVVRAVPAVRVAELGATAAGFEPAAVGPVIGPLFSDLADRLGAAGVVPDGPGIAYYDGARDGAVVVHACLPIGPDCDVADPDVAVVELPALEQAATITHHGPMDAVLSTIQALAHWIDTHGYRSTGYNREVYLHHPAGDPAGWVTELQEPVARSRS